MKKTGVCMLLLLAGCLALVALACGSGGGGDSAPTTTATLTQPVAHTLGGEFILMEEVYGGWAQPCQGGGLGSSSGYSDIRDGAQVVVRDGKGAVLGTGELVNGRRLPVDPEKPTESAPMHCTFDFTISGLPQSDFYAIEVGHRGELTYSYSDLEARGWKVELTLGED